VAAGGIGPSSLRPQPLTDPSNVAFIQRLSATYPQVGKSGILNIDNDLLRTNSQQKLSIGFLYFPESAGLLPQQFTDLCPAYPPLTREN
jgi:hypothetical protein